MKASCIQLEIKSCKLFEGKGQCFSGVACQHIDECFPEEINIFCSCGTRKTRQCDGEGNIVDELICLDCGT